MAVDTATLVEQVRELIIDLAGRLSVYGPREDALAALSELEARLRAAEEALRKIGESRADVLARRYAPPLTPYEWARNIARAALEAKEEESDS